MDKPQNIFHLSDIHFGYEDRDALAWVEREVAEHQPIGMVITGDLTMRARHHEFAAAKAWIDGLDCPVMIEPGNHDLPSYALPERYLTPLKRFFSFKAEAERRFDLPGLAFVPLNSNVAAQPRLNWSKGWVSDAALAECLTRIDSLTEGTQALVCVHHPLRETGTQGTALTHNGAKALAELAKRNIAGVLSGHVHDAFDIMEDTPHGPVRMIGAGTLSQRLRKTPPGFNMLIWDGEALQVRVRSLGEAVTTIGAAS